MDAPVIPLVPMFPVIGDAVTSVIPVLVRIAKFPAVPRFTHFVPLNPPQTTGPVAAVTVNVSASEVCPPKAAVMFVVPAAMPVATPVLDTIVALVGSLEVQTTPEAAV